MEDQHSLFDRAESQRLKQRGMEQAAGNRPDGLDIARRLAIEIAQKRDDSLCYADLVQINLLSLGISLGPAAGSIFRGRCWEFTGNWHASIRSSNHGRLQRIWKYVGE